MAIQHQIGKLIKEQDSSIIIARELAYDTDQLATDVGEKRKHKNRRKDCVYQSAITSVNLGKAKKDGKSGHILFFDAPGGTGKSYVLCCVLHSRTRFTAPLFHTTAFYVFYTNCFFLGNWFLE